MSDGSAKPVIFISYAHADEPEKPVDGETKWLSFVQRYLQPAVKDGIFDLWVDRDMLGGADWDPEIEQKLRACDVFILLVSANSMASTYIIDKEIAIIRERQANAEDVHFYPLLLTPTPDAGLNKVRDKNLRPRDARAFSGFPYHDRLQHMTEAANEIGKIAQQIVERKSARTQIAPAVSAAYVHITGLPETAYEKLRGRYDELKRLDDAWADRNTNILSLVAEGGAGKSALVNEWLKGMRADNYRDAETVLGWSFYSQGTKERATSAEQFLSWAIRKLGIKIETTSATANGEAIAEELTKRRVLLVLDGCEPLQHGLDKQQGELKDQGLRALLRRFASAPPVQTHGLVVLTSRVAVKDIARWQDSSAPVEPVDELSDEAGAALLRDNGVWGTDEVLRAAVRDFGGHPLALGLLASFLKETQFGDVRRRDHIRQFFADAENPRHDHARRVMESYEKEWLAGQPILLAILQIIGLFDRPASGDCLRALRQQPVIPGLTDVLIDLGEGGWQRAVARLCEVGLLAPSDPSAPDALDAHPLVREWFGERLKQTNEAAWKAAHGQLYEHLRDTTKEGEAPPLEDLTPLYQAIAHGCHAELFEEVLNDIYVERICRRYPNGGMKFHSKRVLGALSSDLAAISWFFEKPFERPAKSLTSFDQSWILSEAAVGLRAQGRIAEALPALQSALRIDVPDEAWRNAASVAQNLIEVQLLLGQIDAAIGLAEVAIEYADKGGGLQSVHALSLHTYCLNAAGRTGDAQKIFELCERRQAEVQPKYPLLYALQGYRYCDHLLQSQLWSAVQSRCATIFQWEPSSAALLDRASQRLASGRVELGLALTSANNQKSMTAAKHRTKIAYVRLDEAISYLQRSGHSEFLPLGLLSRSTFRRSVGDWGGGARDLDEVEEIAAPGPMKLYLCDMALERARLAFAKIEAFAPLNGLINDSPLEPVTPDATERASLKEEAVRQLAIAADFIKTCGYHRRDEELSELHAVLRGERKFADLPPRV